MSDKNFKIGIDIDDVVADFRNSFLNYYKNLRNFDVDKARDSVLLKTFFNDKDFERDIYDFHHTKEFRELGLIDFSKDAINHLKEKNELIFVTSRPKNHKEVTKDFIMRNFSGDIKIIHSEEMEEKNEGKILTKGEICEKENLDIMIEDNPDYALDCAERGIYVFVLNQPRNKEYDFSEFENIEKVNDWEELLDKLNRFNKLKIDKQSL